MEDKLDSTAVIDYLNELIETEKRVGDPVDEIKAIFEKIQSWKQKMGDQMVQSQEVSKQLRSKEKVKVHNVKSMKRKLEELQRPIGLSNDEMLVIVYTSIDHDCFTNLLCMTTDFMKWFNLNFEGESREELDFLQAKIGTWRATTSLAGDVLAATKKM